MGTLHENKYTFSIISRSLLLRMKNISDKVVEKLETHISFSVNYFFFENRSVFEIMWKNIVERGRSQMTKWRMHSACWIPKAENTHSNHVILIAFPLQQRLQVHASRRSRFSVTSYVHCLSCLEPDIPHQFKIPGNHQYIF